MCKCFPVYSFAAFNHFPKSGGSTIKGQLIGNSKVERSRMPGRTSNMIPN